MAIGLWWILLIGIAIASYAVQSNLKRKFKKYSKVNVGVTGADVARRMLAEHGITDVQVTSTRGHLTDHYNPQNKTVNLSEGVFNSTSVAAVAVAAHECGHAVQHAESYAPLKLRSALVPAVSFSSKWVTWLLLGGLLLFQTFPQLLLMGIVLYGITTIFSFVTLPVEIDASVRATNWLRESGLTSGDTQTMAVSALRSAAYTYVVAAVASLATLLYYILIFTTGRD